MKPSFFVTLAICAFASAWSFAAESAARPNVVIILADDLGYGSVGCFGADHQLVRTPNIDRLAQEGRRFTDANTTASVCTPTRYSILTGRYCWRTSLKYETLNTFAPLLIEPSRYNMASMLKAHGYNTAAIGKWHLGYGLAENDPKYRVDYTAELKPGPLEMGFDYHFSVPQNHGDITGVYVEDHYVYGLRSGKIPTGMKLPGPVPDDENFAPTYFSEMQQGRGQTPIEIDAPRRVDDRVMPELTDQAVHWIEQQKAGTPFFLYFAPVAVHEPVTPSRDTKGTSSAGIFGDWIHELDRTVGRVLDALDQQGLTENTLVIFTSDNGGVFEPANKTRPESVAVQDGLAVNGSWRGGKTHVFEGGFKVPFVARWPGKVPAGTESREMISLVDILATTAAVVGETLPPAEKAAEDSYSFLPALLGEKYAAPMRPDMIVHSNDGVFAIRKGPWKWIEGVPVPQIGPALRKAHAPEFRRQLYNLADDPMETKDVSEQHPEVVKDLETLLNQERDAGHTRDLPRAAGGAVGGVGRIGPIRRTGPMMQPSAAAIVDASTMRGKVMCGYQGWFRCPGDAAGLGWIHYCRSPKIAPESLTVEMWPDVRELTKAERFPAPDFTLPDGSPAELFSSDNAATVERHFEWMREYGIDGAYLQHFLVDLPGGPSENRYATRRSVLDHVRHAAENTGRVWAISFDVAAVPTEQIYDLLTAEWRRLVDEKITSGPRYLHEQGLPVVQIWGFYWQNQSNHMSADVAEKLVAFFKQPGPYAAFLAGGGDWDWRRNPDKEWQAVYRKFGAYSPWNVGNISTAANSEKQASTNYWADDKAECEKNGVFWMPVVYPGFSWDNLQQKPPGTTNISRRGGQFLWEQFHTLSKLGVDSVYVAMFDEIDEGTAIFKVTSEPPTQGHFVGYEGLPSDWYLRLVGEGGRLLKQHLPVPAEISITP